MLEVWSIVAASLGCACLNTNSNGFVMAVGCTVVVLLLSVQPPSDEGRYKWFEKRSPVVGISARAATVDASPPLVVVKKEVVDEKVANPRMKATKKTADDDDTTSPSGDVEVNDEVTPSCVYSENTPSTGPRHWATTNSVGRRTKQCQERLRAKMMDDFFEEFRQYK